MTLAVRNLFVVGSFLIILSGGFLFISIFGYLYKPPPTQRYIFIAESRLSSTKFSAYDTSLKNNRLHDLKKPHTYDCPVHIFKDVSDPSMVAFRLKTCLREMLDVISFDEFHNHDLYYHISDDIIDYCLFNDDLCQVLYQQIIAAFKSIGVQITGEIFTTIDDFKRGFYTWVSENLNLGNFYNRDINTVATMFIGKRSNSIVTNKKNILQNDKLDSLTRKVNVFSEEYELVSLEYPCYGISEALLSIIFREIKKNHQSSKIKMHCFPTNKLHTFDTMNLWTSCRSRPVDVVFNKEYTLTGTGDYKSCVDSIMEIFLTRTSPKNIQNFPSYQSFTLLDNNISVINGLFDVYSKLELDKDSKLTEILEKSKKCFSHESLDSFPVEFCFDWIYTTHFIAAVANDIKGIEFPETVHALSYEDGMATSFASGILFLPTKTIFRLVGLLSFLLSTFIFLFIGLYMFFKTTQVQRQKKFLTDPQY